MSCFTDCLLNRYVENQKISKKNHGKFIHPNAVDVLKRHHEIDPAPAWHNQEASHLAPYSVVSFDVADGLPLS